MKKIFGKFLKIFVYVSYPVLLITLIVMTVLFLVKTRELNGLNNTFQQAQQELNKDVEDQQITIADLTADYRKLTEEVTRLNKENAELQANLDEMQLEGYASISGKVFPIVTSNNQAFSQYQRVCAVSTSNSNVQFCRTVSVVEQKYTLNLPVGTYNIYAEVYPEVEGNKKAYYTEYVKCVNEKGSEQCNASKLNKAVAVQIKAGESKTAIDPIDWR